MQEGTLRDLPPSSRLRLGFRGRGWALRDPISRVAVVRTKRTVAVREAGESREKTNFVVMVPANSTSPQNSATKDSFVSRDFL